MKDWIHVVFGAVGLLASIWGGAYLYHVAEEWAEYPAILTTLFGSFSFGIYGWVYLGYAVGALKRD